ncbi:hypothetical protein [Clostridium botulinum]|nr:hypothetical protein [Clostridium botulinum]
MNEILILEEKDNTCLVRNIEYEYDYDIDKDDIVYSNDLEYVKCAIKHLFQTEQIKIELNQYDEWEDKKINVKVKIDDEEVMSYSKTIGSSGWSDY